MLSWSIGFFVAAIVAAIFGFGGIASAFAGIAQLLFWLFVGLLVVSLLLGVFRGTAHTVDGHGPATHPGSGIAFLAVAAVLGAAVYAWMDNDMSAEKAGRSIDRTASEITADAGEAIEQAGDRAENLIQETSSEIRTDTANGLDEASDNVEAANNP
ncbi:hypothetical protein U91I_03696 [alpha proteobacterium U9-1i]|nr:hypothetical protein U91I_03696 [alpha proteobacterium U9-1i]